MKRVEQIFRYILTGYIFERRKMNKKMKKFVGENLNGISDSIDKKIVVYTVVFGNYDKIQEPYFKSKYIDYYAITDQPLSEMSIWKKIDIHKFSDITNLSLKDKSRYFKIHPEYIFPEYDFSIYLDGNVQLAENPFKIINKMVSEKKLIALHNHSLRDCVYNEGRIIIAFGVGKIKDVKKQLKKYKKEGFPKHFGLFDNCIIVRMHNEDDCKKVMNVWWNEYMMCPCKRDQLTFVYSLWKVGMKKEDLFSLGSNAYANPTFRIVEHESKVRVK